MWSFLNPWGSGSAQNKEREVDTKHTKAEGSRQQLGGEYYQRNKTDEQTAKASETTGMDKIKAKFPARAQKASGDQQHAGKSSDAELDSEWGLVENEDLKKLQGGGGSQAGQASTPEEEMKGRGITYLGSELMAGSGPASTLSVDSEAYSTPLSSLSGQDGGIHRSLVQTDASDSDVILKLQEDNKTRAMTIRKLQQEVNQLQQRLKYAEQLEEQILRLTTEESEHEQEKQLMKAEIQKLHRTASVSRPYTRSYAHEQKLQELAKRYEQQYNEQLEENSMLREKISYLEREMQELEGGTTYLGDMGDSDMKVKLKQREQHIHTLQTQVKSLQQHSKRQSRQVLQLKLELEALKTSGEEIDTAWRNMVDQLEEENRKLSVDVGGFRRDKNFLEKSMEALKTRNVELEPLVQTLQAQLGELEVKEEWARKHVESTTANNRKVYQRSRELEKENRQLGQQLRKLSDFRAETNTQVHDMKAQIRKLEEEKEALQNADSEIGHFKKHNDDLILEMSKMMTELEKFVQQLAEKDELLQAARGEQLQLRQQTLEKDSFIQDLLNEKEALRRQVSLYGEQIQSQQAQQSDHSKLWEVPRMEVNLNMQKILGTGAWGFVVEGTFRGQQVAVKCLHDMIRSPRIVGLIRKEIGIMAQVRHPNLVLLIAAVIDTKNDPLIVTELLDVSLRKAYETKLVQASSKLNIFRDIAAALNYLHLHHCGEIIHRDVSSANVLLEAKPNNRWKAKLSDFGSAKLAMEAKTTAPGAFVYSAPEVLKDIGIHQTAKVDVYSYGILLCEVTVEQFPDEDSLAGMRQDVQSKWAFMHRLITSCVQYHPDKRPTMSFVLGELNKQQPLH